MIPQSGIISSCTDYIQASAGDTCSTLLAGYYSYLPVSLFTEWNPAVGSSCSNLLAGYYYCVATTDIGPQPGTISTCKKYHRVVSGDSCWSIEQEAGITSTQFNRWNRGPGRIVRRFGRGIMFVSEFSWRWMGDGGWGVLWLPRIRSCQRVALSRHASLLTTL